MATHQPSLIFYPISKHPRVSSLFYLSPFLFLIVCRSPSTLQNCVHQAIYTSQNRASYHCSILLHSFDHPTRYVLRGRASCWSSISLCNFSHYSKCTLHIRVCSYPPKIQYSNCHQSIHKYLSHAFCPICTLPRNDCDQARFQSLAHSEDCLSSTLHI